MLVKGFRIDASFFNRIYGREKDVVIEAPFVAVMVVHERDESGVVKPLMIHEPLVQMGPVFLFNVGIVVFVMIPAAGQANVLFEIRKVSSEMIVEEIAASFSRYR